MLKEDFTRYVSHGLRPQDAMELAIKDTLAYLSSCISHGESLPDALRRLDLLSNEEFQNIRRSLSAGEFRFEDDTKVLRYFVKPEKLSKIPSPSCMERHLPKDKRPTRQDIEEAWKKCTSR